MRWIFLLFSLFAQAHAKHCTFIPPSGWEIAQLKTPSPHVKIGFVGKGSGEFRPSINLAEEEVDVSLKEYVKAVKELQLADPMTQWRDLGKFPMNRGEGRLIEISNPSPWGELKILQALFVEGNRAYILTGAVLKEDFLKVQNELLQSFRSLTLAEDLWTPIKDAVKRAELETFFATLGFSEDKEMEWEHLQKKIVSHVELGPYWQFLALQEGHAKIYKQEKQ